MIQMRLSDIAEFCRAPVEGDAGTVINDICTDSRKATEGCLFVPLAGEKFDGHSFIDSAIDGGAAAVICAQPDISVKTPVIRVADTLEALHRIALGYRKRFAPHLVAVTGSVGKTTTKEMIAAVLSKRYKTLKNAGNFNNAIGLPLTLLKLDLSIEAAVTELGMNHAGEISVITRIALPDTAVITNIGVAHIEYLGSREAILAAKLEILDGLPSGGVCVFNGDEPLLWNLRNSTKYDTVYFGIDNPSLNIKAKNIADDGKQTRFTVSSESGEYEIMLNSTGRHMIYNALAAVAVGERYGLTHGQIADGLADWKPDTGRQTVFEIKDITVIDDTYNASPDSMRASLNVLLAYAPRRRIAVLGGMLELGAHSEEAHRQIGRLAASSADLLFLYGVGSQDICSGAQEGGMTPDSVKIFDNHIELGRAIARIAERADVVLFKGSRGMRMEDAMTSFREEYADG